jgi:phosphoadenosine phosphosulfate reductase
MSTAAHNPLTESEAAEINTRLSAAGPAEILEWAASRFGTRMAAQASMQKTSCVLMHMLSTIAPATEIIFVDTGVHFPETLALRDEMTQRYGLNMRTYAAARSFDQQATDFGYFLHLEDDTDARPGYRKCCELRKEEPYLAAVKGRFDAVIGGLMASEGGARASVKVVSYDPRFEGWKVYPLANWTERQVEEYTEANGIPVHGLYAQGYTSIGCHTCTTPTAPGEHPRAGRWRHISEKVGSDQPLYCGINFGEGGKVERTPKG